MPLRCRIIHCNGRESEVNPKEFKYNLELGNLIQSARQRQADRFLAYVLPGLVAYTVHVKTLRYDDRAGAMLVFEPDCRVAEEEIELRLINECDLDPEKAALLASSIVHKQLVSGLRTLPGGPRAGNVWEGLYLAHILRSGFLSKEEAERCRHNVEPLVLAEPVIAGDPSTAFALW